MLSKGTPRVPNGGELKKNSVKDARQTFLWERPTNAICTVQREDLETKEDSKKCQENAEQQREETGGQERCVCRSPAEEGRLGGQEGGRDTGMRH